MTKTNAGPAKSIGFDGRPDLELIASLIPGGVRMLDIGCANGKLLNYLVAEKKIDGRGIELSQAGVNICVARGLSVIQGDADADLIGYPDNAFDFVVLSQTIQATRSPRDVLEHLVRIGRHAIVSLPNFGHWRMRMNFLLSGRMPETKALPHTWYDTPNIHLCTVADFESLCRKIDVKVERIFAVGHGRGGYSREVSTGSGWSNLTAEEAVFLLSK